MVCCKHVWAAEKREILVPHHMRKLPIIIPQGCTSPQDLAHQADDNEAPGYGRLLGVHHGGLQVLSYAETGRTRCGELSVYDIGHCGMSVPHLIGNHDLVQVVFQFNLLKLCPWHVVGRWRQAAPLHHAAAKL